ncbi:hypothetical protein BU26DRAFT_514401 [Trematosphaeria pertusa]|uniref:Autophagy protein n=1 Tax=Trematosphaeria pertusa TaxID=390896 RepID=A0A6A6IXZ8_9PLEO|nr:uncharacterized protein BU26DRAFT_514401 [Trematosphaeria pertusa]KAF2254500.1 hypothetical protein BU26DRAFT_514401 [Trematosphaeria pertusa]
MGWLWGGRDSSASKDKLDPSLRDFLEKEAPTGPKPSLPSKPAQKPAESHAPEQTQAEAPLQPAVPPQSQFQDGRYAHLWKNYVPQQVLEDQGKTEQDKLRDIVDAYNDRKAEIGRIALENCSLEYMAQFDCFRNPGFWQAATLCRAESQKFNRCYDVQSKFLKALGYLTMDARSPEDSERIQMHADKLYHQMLEQEAQIEKAKEEGRPIPKFESVLSKQNVARAMAGKFLTATPVSETNRPDDDDAEVWRHIKPESRQRYEKQLAEIPPEDQEFERKALLGELRAQTGMAKKVEETFIEERINRMKRREAGQATIGDTLKRLWGWG